VNREVTQEKFATFLAWLGTGGGGAGAGGGDPGEEYERLRFRLCTFFSQRRCRFPEELADETINRVIIKVGEETIENRLAYFYGVAKNVYRESLRKERDHLDVDELSVAAPSAPEPDFSAECLDRCLARLPPESRGLVLEYFSEVKHAKVELHRRISESFRVSQTALRMRVMRIKQKLAACVRECMCGEGAVT
jgi:DNA-directed RNA polymerase specialized sigma24 family protein